MAAAAAYRGSMKMTVQCGVCIISTAKYKCPSCQLQYCSIACYKAHQSVHPDNSGLPAIHTAPNDLPAKPPPVASDVNPLGPHSKSYESLISSSALDSLASSVNLQQLYIRYPKLRNQLREIYEATKEPSNDPSDDYPSSRGYGDRDRGRARVRGRGHGRGLGASWAQEKGFKAGLHQMRKLRHLRGDDGEGLREFFELLASLSKYDKPETAASLM